MHGAGVSHPEPAQPGRPPERHDPAPNDEEGAQAGSVAALVIALERAHPEDEAFLFAVYASTRVQEMALTGWLPAQQEQFLRMQFEAQTRSYRIQFPNADHWVVRGNGIAAGRMVVSRAEEEILLIDIALLPEHRGKKIGSLLMDRLQEEAWQAGKTVHVHVERFNPALRWYERLGFKPVGEGEIYLEMVWQPGPIEATPGKVAQ